MKHAHGIAIRKRVPKLQPIFCWITTGTSNKDLNSKIANFGELMRDNWRSRLTRVELISALKWLICDNGLPVTILLSLIAINISYIESKINNGYISYSNNTLHIPTHLIIITIRDFIASEEQYIILLVLALLWILAGFKRGLLEPVIRRLMRVWLANEIIKSLSIMFSKGPLAFLLNFLNSVTFIQLCIISPEDLGKIFGIGNELPEMLWVIKFVLIILFVAYVLVVGYLERHVLRRCVLPSELKDAYKLVNIVLFLLFIPLYYFLQSKHYSPLTIIIFLIFLTVLNFIFLIYQEFGKNILIRMGYQDLGNKDGGIMDIPKIVLGTNKIEFSRKVNPDKVYVDRQGTARDVIQIETILEIPNDIRQPIDIVILVDRSGTMRNMDKGGKKRKSFLKNFIVNLKESGGFNGRLSLIYFNNTADIRLELVDFIKNAQKALEAIDKMPNDEGATDYKEAFNAALKVLNKAEANANIVFISDGVMDGGYNYDKNISKTISEKRYKIYPIGIGVDEDSESKPDFEEMAELTKGKFLSSPTIDDLDATLNKLANMLLPYKTLWTETEIVECLPGYLERKDEPKAISPDPSRYPSPICQVQQKGERTILTWKIGNLDGLKGKWSFSYSVRLKTQLSINCFASSEDSYIRFKEDEKPTEYKLSPIYVTFKAPGLLRYLFNIDR